MHLTPTRVLATCVAAGALVIAAGAGCTTSDDKGLGDAPVDQLPDRKIAAYPNADAYPNVAAFCIGGNGIYTNTRDGDPVDIVVDDPECKTGGALAGRGAGVVPQDSTVEDTEGDG